MPQSSKINDQEGKKNHPKIVRKAFSSLATKSEREMKRILKSVKLANLKKHYRQTSYVKLTNMTTNPP